MSTPTPGLNRTQRNLLRNSVTQCRRLLEDETAKLLEGQFGIHRTGRVEPLSALRQLGEDDRAYRTQVLDHLAHIEASLRGARRTAASTPERVPADVIEQLVREVAFTHLNRLCAFKMIEQLRLTNFKETVGRGWNSNGFLFYLVDHPEDERRFNGGEQALAYRNFLLWQAEQLAGELVALFSPLDLAGRLFPSQRVLDELLALINSPELAPVWAVPETIGWIYQYFTPRELRERARSESSAPRNSYELAFRNQFYTPDYVVAFLADNTLGRIWYEMRQGDTALKEQCRYLVFRPGEHFVPPDAPASDDPLAMRFRPKRDPRTLRVLDPACGSGHFLIYCFGLLETIYREAYDDAELGPPLQQAFPDQAEYERHIPDLILEHNLHGLDIDLRAVQIAGLALWLRAHTGGQRGDQRLPIRRANLVRAEPMPGDAALLDEFAAALQPPLLGQLLRTVFEEMRLAGEAGSLLKIDTAITNAIAQARRQWLEQPPAQQLAMFADHAPAQRQGFDLSGISDEQFWDQAENRLLEQLHTYAAGAAQDDHRRRLFADDAEQGFAFIELCRRRYDVLLMNPPFGAPSRDSKAYLERSYPRTKNDLYAAFVERGLALLDPGGMLGAITSRTGFFLTSFQKWREEILLEEARLTVVADLGIGVLDTAMVETAAYCMEKVA